MQSILLGRRFYCNAEMLLFYKAHILSYAEYRTPGIYHATSTALAELDHVQTRFLREIGISAVEALLHFNLAPMGARRDMAMLGVIHRAVLHKGPPQLWPFFQRDDAAREHSMVTRSMQRRHSRHLRSYRVGAFYCMLQHSILGLIDVYNLLPAHVVEQTTVKDFQRDLQEQLRNFARMGREGWELAFSPRFALHEHPLQTWA